MKRLNFYLKIFLIVTPFIVIYACAVNPVTGKKQLMLMSVNQEIEMGRQYDPEVVGTFGEYHNAALQALIEEKGIAIGKISHRPTLEYHFRVLDSPVINAFAVPGGYVYLTRGIIAQLNNEAELAGVIGHEMGHIAARHTASQQSKQQIGELLLIGGIIASKELQQYADYAMQGMQLLFLKFSRDNEREADRLGVEYSSKTGYDAHKMADFFQVLNKMNMASNHGGVPTFLSTHPDPGDRYNSVNLEAAKWQEKLKLSSYKVNEESYLHMIDGMVYGEDPRQGFVEGNTFFHPGMKFKFSFPAGWQLENSPMQVTMAPKDGKALMIFTQSKQKTVEEASTNTIDQLGLTLLENKKSTVNGMPAIMTLSKQISRNQSTGSQDTVRILSCFIDCNNSVFAFHGLAAEAGFTGFSKTLDAAMRSFSKLSDPVKLNIKPKRIKVKDVQRTSTLSETLKSLGVPEKQMNEIALLNNLELTNQVQKGKLIKIIGD